MQFNVGYQLMSDSRFIDYIVSNKEHIGEVYYSWGDFPNGRNLAAMNQDMMPWETQGMMLEQLGVISQTGIALNLLLNGNCYGRDSQSKAFFQKVGDTIDYFGSRYALSSITTTSPLIAKFVNANFEGMDIRASVNMSIGTVQGMRYVQDYFDSFYMQRELNRDFNAIQALHKWCMENGKQMYLLANSGCLNNCSVHNFHDNLVAHENEIVQMDNAYQFTGICKEYLRDERNYPDLYNQMNFVRPEDINLYEPYFAGAKLATRVHRNPIHVVNSYISGQYSGNLLDILEPAHSIYPYVLENGSPVRLVKIDDQLSIYEYKEPNL